jgi:hypothetical protein
MIRRVWSWAGLLCVVLTGIIIYAGATPPGKDYIIMDIAPTKDHQIKVTLRKPGQKKPIVTQVVIPTEKGITLPDIDHPNLANASPWVRGGTMMGVYYMDGSGRVDPKSVDIHDR